MCRAAARGSRDRSERGRTGHWSPALTPTVHLAGSTIARRVRDRLRDGPKRLQAPFSAKSPLQTAFKASTLGRHEPADVQGLLRAERRRNRTYPAWGCQASPVLKPCSLVVETSGVDEAPVRVG